MPRIAIRADIIRLMLPFIGRDSVLPIFRKIKIEPAKQGVVLIATDGVKLGISRSLIVDNDNLPPEGILVDVAPLAEHMPTKDSDYGLKRYLVVDTDHGVNLVVAVPNRDQAVQSQSYEVLEYQNQIEDAAKFPNWRSFMPKPEDIDTEPFPVKVTAELLHEVTQALHAVHDHSVRENIGGWPLLSIRTTKRGRGPCIVQCRATPYKLFALIMPRSPDVLHEKFLPDWVAELVENRSPAETVS